jgi:hypothetical protein
LYVLARLFIYIVTQFDTMYPPKSSRGKARSRWRGVSQSVEQTWYMRENLPISKRAGSPVERLEPAKIISIVIRIAEIILRWK